MNISATLKNSSWKSWVALVATCGALSACADGRDGEYTSLQCAPYARNLTGVKLRGNAASWWRQSMGKYAHSHHPVPGSILVFRSTRRMPYGHVSVVHALEDDRTVLVDHANWEPHQIDHVVPIVDVSRRNDWSAVKVWWSPIHGMGRTIYPTYGFIIPGEEPSEEARS